MSLDDDHVLIKLAKMLATLHVVGKYLFYSIASCSMNSHGEKLPVVHSRLD